MRRVEILAAAALAAVVAAHPAASQSSSMPARGVTTAALAELCGANPTEVAGAAAAAYCRGFLIAAGQYHAELTQGPARRPPVFCLAGPAPTVEAAQASFVAWARANPQHAEDKALIGVMRWAASAHPCPDQAAARPARR
jgi:hypothetical protein